MASPTRRLARRAGEELSGRASAGARLIALGSEATCRVRFNDEVSEGKALLETTEIIFRGDFRLKIPFSDIQSLDDADGELTVGFSQGRAVFDLGRDASKWAEKIRNPRGLIDKLGVKQGQIVSVLGVDDPEFIADLRKRTEAVSEGQVPPEADFVFFEAGRHEDLYRLRELRAAIKPRGAVWVVSPKGKNAVVKDVDVMAAARDAGLVDTKVVAFSATHTALKLVIPVSKR